MTIKSNFDSTLLLCNGIVRLWSDEHAVYYMRLPVLKDKYEEPDFDSFLGFCATPIDVLNTQLQKNYKNRIDIWNDYKRNGQKNMIKILVRMFGKYMINFEYADDLLKWNKRIIPRQILDYFCDYFAIACGVKDIKELNLIITDDMDEFDKKRIEMERKIAKTKKQGDHAVGPGFDRILAGVNKEFNYTMTELYNMTIYAIYYLYSQLGYIMAYEITNISAGNGLLKKNTKHTHWVDRKDR